MHTAARVSTANRFMRKKRLATGCVTENTVTGAGSGRLQLAHMSILQQSKLTGFVATVKPDAAKDFYADILGLTLIEDSRYALVFDSNGTMVRVQKVKEFSPQPFTALGWNVADIQAAVAELTQRGVKMLKTEFVEQDALGIWTTPDGSRIAWFLDPDGNTLSLAQMGS